MTAVEHAMRGTYRPGLHGPLPAGVVPLPRRGTNASPQPEMPRAVALVAPSAPPPPPDHALTADDCPDILTDEGKALWRILVTQRPTEKVLAPFVAMYVEAMLAWQRATREVIARGDYGRVGAKLTPNPYLRLRREAEATLFRVAQLLGWQAPLVQASPTPEVSPPRSRLELFLSSRSRA